MMRITAHATTGMSPFLVVFGRDPEMPLDQLFHSSQRDSTSLDVPRPVAVHEYVTKLTDTLTEAYAACKLASIKAAAITQKRLDAKKRMITFNTGDLVIYWCSRDDRSICSGVSAAPNNMFIIGIIT